MANFKTHITTSTVLGFGYAGLGYAAGASPEAALLAGGLCGIAGMLPDIDSDKGIPLRETMSFISAIVPLLLIDRMQHLGLSYESMILTGGALYIFFRFGVTRLIARYTVHRGMFHSIPAALIFAGLAFLMCGCSNISLRYYKAGAVFLGFMSHLVLDEIYSIEIKRGRVRVKNSSGTALKIWGNDLWANFSVYAKLLLVVGAIMMEPTFMQKYGTANPLHVAKEQIERIENHFEHSGENPDGSTSSFDRSVYDTARRMWDGVFR